ncbi:hypothetical protein SAMN04487850_1575 [Prevotella aff. ruminicola Tc2-24]|uniref:Uncharacterized protein n=1 Tax=Prevotella aff. ruminicola Tc2-24 TaxID=81582 RepID=A0A1I0P459_9BACT|nr:hypothetical protein [Prevotella aff. ruminicola Tc2-24]SEW08964.1 hypothetical protein SAMN04487850_1575 [Prevotella aff. ruminicola Tc2-24]
MKYLKFKYNIGSVLDESFFERVLSKFLRIIFFWEDPDFGELYSLVETWYIEYDEIDEQDGAYREVGRDAYGRIIVKDPDERNSGFWSDTNMGLNDYIKQMHAEYISKEEFEAVWNEELVKVDKKSYR